MSDELDNILSKSKKLIIDREGIRNKVYLDSVKKNTIGIGHLIDITNDSKKNFELFQNDYKAATGKDLNYTSIEDVDLSEEDSMALKRHDASKKLNMLKSIAGDKWNEFSDNQKTGLLSMAFQLGLHPSKYKDTAKMIKEGRLEDLSKVIGKWDWAKQTPVRAKDAELLLTNFKYDSEISYGKSSHLRDLMEQPSTEKSLDGLMNELSKPEVLEDGQEEPTIPTEGTELDIMSSRNYRSISANEEPIVASETSEDVMSLDSQTDWGGKPREFSNSFESIRNFALEGMGDDLVNKFIDRNAVGFLTQAAIETGVVSGKYDPKFNALEDKEFYNEVTKGLDNVQVENILSKSNNRTDFIKLSALEQGRSKRKNEMQKYTETHPVLSGVNTIGNMLTEGAAFMPVSSIIGSATAATEIKVLSDLSRRSMLSRNIVGEAVEQGLQEVIWSKYDRDYKFDPITFAAGMGVGVGLKQAFGNVEANKALRDLISNEGGFINLATNEGKKLVDEVAKNVTDNQAIAMAERVVKKKVEAANDIRINMEKTRSALVRTLSTTDDAIKFHKGDIEKLKKLKSKKQNIARKLNSFDEKLPSQLKSLANGTHPKLTAKVNPEFSLKNIAKELDIDPKLVNTTAKARKFLGLDSIDVDPDFIFEGEKKYQNIARKQLAEMADNKRFNMNETLRYVAGTDTVKDIDALPIIGKLQIGDKLRSLADTDGPISRLLFNKGNLVSSDNELAGSLYNFLASDGMGRQGMSKIRAIESQQKYSSIYGGDLLTMFHAHGDDIYEKLNGSVLSRKIKGFLSPDDYEKTVEPLLKERLLDSTGQGFRSKYGDEIADIADNFYKDFNKLNKKIVERAKEVGVEGVNFDATDGWFHRSWDFRKARAVDSADLEDTVFRAMKSHMEKLGIEFDEDVIKSSAKKFSYGLRNADITNIEGLQSDHIKLLEKLLNKADDVETPVIRGEVERLKILKMKHDAGDLANRVQMDVDQKLSDGRSLSDLLEDNVIHTQKRYTSRMAARIAAAEHGIKNIDDLDEWVADAVELETKRLAAKGHPNPKEGAKFMKEAMTQDVQSFKVGGMVGIHDLPEDSVSDFLRLAKKYNYARLMQYTGISSIAELGGTFVEAGVSNTLREMKDSFVQHLHDLYIDSPSQYTNRLYDEMRSITGIGMEDFAFSSKGLSGANRVTESGAINAFEKGIDSIGRVTQGTFGGIETVGRRISANSLAIKWANHFTGNEKGGLLSAFFGSNGFSNRVLENSGFGTVDSLGKFVPNSNYKAIGESFKKFATFDKDGRLIRLNLDKWDNSVAHSFGDAVQMQVNHIMVNPDSTTMALWQSTTVGQILNQFRTFTVNATTKVFGQAVANAAVSSSRGDASEMIKGAQKIFWGTSLGMLSVSLRQGIQRAGGDKEVDLFDEGAIKAAAIGFSRSSIAGNIPTIADTLSGAFGIDPIFEKTSSIGRSKNFFNLATTPTGQAVSGVAQGTGKIIQGDFKEGGMQLLKTSPVYRQIGAQQIFNFLESK